MCDHSTNGKTNGVKVKGECGSRELRANIFGEGSQNYVCSEEGARHQISVGQWDASYEME
jgi:hypothetical protein